MPKVANKLKVVDISSELEVHSETPETIPETIPEKPPSPEPSQETPVAETLPKRAPGAPLATSGGEPPAEPVVMNAQTPLLGSNG